MLGLEKDGSVRWAAGTGGARATGGGPAEVPPSAEVLAAAAAAERHFNKDLTKATEEDLNAGLLVVCLPLGGDLPACEAAPSAFDDVGACFLPSRTYRSTEGEDTFWTLPEARVVATSLSRAPLRREAALAFGCSRGSLTERDQPLFSVPSSCVSLWHVSGRGYVLVLERLGNIPTAEELDETAAWLREGTVPWISSEKTVEQVFARLLEHRASLPRTGSRLEDLLPDLPDAMRGRGVLSDLLVHRPVVTRGQREYEGMVFAIAPGAGEAVKKLLPHYDHDSEYRQELGRVWRWQPCQLVDEPVEPGAVLAVREDGRAAYVDLEAMSYLHDYVGPGGSEMVAAALPLLAERAAECNDFWSATGIAAALEVDSELGAVRARVERTRRMRTRISRRETLRQLVYTPEQFRDWTHRGQLNAVLHAAAESDPRWATPDRRSSSALEVSGQLLAEVLADRQLAADETRRAVESEQRQYREAETRRREVAADEARARREKDLRRREEDARQQEDEREERERLAQLGGTAIAGAALLGLFAAFAAIPKAGQGVFDPNVAAGFTTLLLALAVALSAMAIHKSMAAQPSPRTRRALRVVGVVLLIGVMGVAAVVTGLLLPASLPLLVALALAGLAGTCALLAARRGRGQRRRG